MLLDRKHLKDLLQTNIKTFVTTHLEAAAGCIPTKSKDKRRSHWELKTVLEKQDNLKRHFYLNPTNTNEQKLKNALEILKHSETKKTRIHSCLCMSLLTIGCNKFRKAPYFSQILLSENTSILHPPLNSCGSLYKDKQNFLRHY